jgi:hypothetical protein
MTNMDSVDELITAHDERDDISGINCDEEEISYHDTDEHHDIPSVSHTTPSLFTLQL